MRQMQEYKVRVSRNGTLFWYNKDNKLHKDNDQPAVIAPEAKCWYQNGQLHRENDKPAIVYASGTEFWFKNGKLHRDNGPAIVYIDGTKCWFKNGEEFDPREEVKELTVADIEELLGYRIKIVK
jgi:hypothetical protein